MNSVCSFFGNPKCHFLEFLCNVIVAKSFFQVEKLKVMIWLK